MLNATDVPPKDSSSFQIIDYADAVVKEAMTSGGVMNVDDATLLANIASSIRLGHSQMRPGPLRKERIVLLGSGPSLDEAEDAIRQLVWEGNTTLVTLNGSYHWAIAHKLRPNIQIVMDARPSNARFLNPPVGQCRYVLASQCAPETFAAVAGRPDTWIFHAVVREEDEATKILDQHYLGNWLGVGGGTTVATRAIHLLRMVGYVQYDLFGIDCCWRGAQHHAVEQPENEHDNRFAMDLTVPGHESMRFWLSPWHLKQFEDFLAVLKLNGQHFQLTVHGGGLLAHAIRLLGTDAEGLSLKGTDEPVAFDLQPSRAHQIGV